MSPKVSDEYKEYKRRELLDAAKRVFIRKGYNSATMQDLMEETTMSRGAVYAYFENIEHAYLEVMQREDEQDRAYFEMEDVQDPWKQLMKWIHLTQEKIEAADQTLYLANTEYFLTIHYRNRNGHASPIDLASRYDRLIEYVTVFINNGVDRKRLFPNMPSDSIARFLVSFIDGLWISTGQLGADRTQVSKQVEILIEALRSMLCPVE